MRMKYWLMKSEPGVFSIDDLSKTKNQTTYWDGVRNYQARNYLRDEIKTGDGVIFYYSNVESPAAAGVCEVVKEGYPDFTAFDSENIHFDPKSDLDKPAWYMVDIRLIRIFKHPVTLSEIRANTKLVNMKLLQRGNRLSVMPVTKEEYDEIVRLGDRR